MNNHAEDDSVLSFLGLTYIDLSIMATFSFKHYRPTTKQQTADYSKFNYN